MKVGDMVKEVERDCEWQLHPGEIGIILEQATEWEKKNAQIPGSGRHWLIVWSTGVEVMEFSDFEIVECVK